MKSVVPKKAAALLLVCIGIAISGLNLPHQALKRKEEKRAAH